MVDKENAQQTLRRILDENPESLGGEVEIESFRYDSGTFKATLAQEGRSCIVTLAEEDFEDCIDDDTELGLTILRRVREALNMERSRVRGSG